MSVDVVVVFGQTKDRQPAYLEGRGELGVQASPLHSVEAAVGPLPDPGIRRTDEMSLARTALSLRTPARARSSFPAGRGGENIRMTDPPQG